MIGKGIQNQLEEDALERAETRLISLLRALNKELEEENRELRADLSQRDEQFYDTVQDLNAAKKRVKELEEELERIRSNAEDRDLR